MKSILDKLPDKLAEKIGEKVFSANEIALRSNKKAVLKINDNYEFIDYLITTGDIRDTFRKMCDMSVYAYLDELQNGYITLRGGHRVGVCGTVVLKDKCIHNVKNITSLNIRIADEHIGCSDKLDFDIKNLLLISPPGCGKTTILRDLCRKLGGSKKVSVVDERGEISGMGRDKSAYDIGYMTDVLSLCDKRTGIEMMLRSMSPEYIVTDEIAEKDRECIINAMSYGVYIIASAHGNNIEKTLERLGLSKNTFDNIVLLSNRNGIGTIEEIYGG